MPLVEDIGHIILQVGDMDEAVRLYRDVLGFALPNRVDPVWTVATTSGGSLTLFRQKSPVPCELPGGDTPITLHVKDFEKAAVDLESKGYRIRRQDAHSGSLIDPWGNVIGLHDHRKRD